MQLVSVIVPVYKVESYLRRCVDSILAQTYTNLEIILIDDGSPDNCGAICDEYAANDNRFVVIHQENQGLSQARNAGLDIASGTYVSFIDSDDAISPHFLQSLVSALENENADIAECGRLDIYDNTLPHFEAIPYTIRGYDRDAAFSLLVPNKVFHQTVWNKVYRRSIIGNLRFPAGKLHEDEFFTWQVFCNCSRVAFLDANLYCYYHRQGSIMETFSPRRLDFFEARMERHKYIVEHFPHLVTLSKLEILLPCIFQTQILLRQGNEEIAKQCQPVINGYYAAVKVTSAEKRTLPLNIRTWITLADRSLSLCAWIRNALGKP